MSFPQDLDTLLADVTDLDAKVSTLIDLVRQQLGNLLTQEFVTGVLKNLINTYQVNLNISPDDFDAAIARYFANGAINLNASSLGGHTADQFVLVTAMNDLVQKVNHLSTSGFESNNLIDLGTL